MYKKKAKLSFCKKWRSMKRKTYIKLGLAKLIYNGIPSQSSDRWGPCSKSQRHPCYGRLAALRQDTWTPYHLVIAVISPSCHNLSCQIWHAVGWYEILTLPLQLMIMINDNEQPINQLHSNFPVQHIDIQFRFHALYLNTKGVFCLIRSLCLFWGLWYTFFWHTAELIYSHFLLQYFFLFSGDKIWVERVTGNCLNQCQKSNLEAMQIIGQALLAGLRYLHIIFVFTTPRCRHVDMSRRKMLFRLTCF